MSEKNATLLGIRLAVGDTSPGCAFAGLDASAWAHITAAVTVSAQSTPCVTHEHNDILVSHGNHFTWGRISAKGFLPLRRIRLAAAIEGDILVRQHVLWMRLAVKLRVRRIPAPAHTHGSGGSAPAAASRKSPRWVRIPACVRRSQPRCIVAGSHTSCDSRRTPPQVESVPLACATEAQRTV